MHENTMTEVIPIRIWHAVGFAGDFPVGEARRIDVGGYAIAVFHVDGEFYALSDRCTHGHASLAEGWVEDGCVECPLHQGLFDLKTGEVRGGCVTEPVLTFPLRLVDGAVQVLA